ncbi:MAG: hypothetical protein CXZ00_15260 [Acidobacteria bacterium]|nr:MAG: hypothetical protein CXZ00_15260 [Acidobacteriota bacterium]
MPFRRDNHYVPCLYLKRFAINGKLWTYPLFVAHKNVPFWRASSPSGIGYRTHLYSRMVAGVESDEFETWLNDEFEQPAEEAIRRATEDLPLTPRHWRALVRFFAAQDVRTPARLFERLQAWNKTVPAMLDEVLRQSVKKLEETRRSGVPLTHTKTPHSELLPIRVSTHIEPGAKFGTVRAETVVGRDYWLFGIKRYLTETLKVLLEHRWTILRPHNGMCWFTSDDPVIKLNYNSLTDYNLGGGWGSAGTELMLPLSPQHLLVTQVGKRPQKRGWRFPERETTIIRSFIAEHAHRLLIAATPDPEVPQLRPRLVNSEFVRNEAEQWRKWHEDQIRTERELMGQDSIPITPLAQDV